MVTVFIKTWSTTQPAYLMHSTIDLGLDVTPWPCGLPLGAVHCPNGCCSPAYPAGWPVIVNAGVHGGFQLPYTAATATFVQAVRVQDADDVVLGDTTGRSTTWRTMWMWRRSSECRTLRWRARSILSHVTGGWPLRGSHFPVIAASDALRIMKPG